MWLAALFASGVPFILGLAIVGTFAVLPFTGRRFVISLCGATIGALLIVLSATPCAWWLAGLAGLAFVAWAALGSFPGWAPHARRYAGLTLCTAGIALLANELRYWPLPHVQRAGRPVYVIGDSISAGIGASEEVPWPGRLAKLAGTEVHNLAVAGATPHQARSQAGRVVATSAVVVLEIGGNDLLGGRAVAAFEADLEALVESVCGPGRAVVMFELPLPPLANRYGAAQRRVAARYGISLIPKRVLAGAIGRAANTVDGLHLSPRGHQMLAEVMARVVSED